MLRSKAENWVPCRDRLLGLEESSRRRTYDADVLATIARHGTTIKWSSPQANDRWGRLGLGWRWRASRRVQKKRWSTRKRLRNRRSTHSTRSLRAWRYYASSSILGLVSVVSVHCINQIPGVPSSLSVRRKLVHFGVSAEPRQLDDDHRPTSTAKGICGRLKCAAPLQETRGEQRGRCLTSMEDLFRRETSL